MLAVDAGPTIGARIRAARVLAGVGSAPKLAEALGLHGAGATKLYMAERDQEPLPYALLAEVAHACKLPVEFFTADFSRMPEISEDPRSVIARETAAAVARAAERRAKSDEDSQPPQEEAR